MHGFYQQKNWFRMMSDEEGVYTNNIHCFYKLAFFEKIQEHLFDVQKFD